MNERSIYEIGESMIKSVDGVMGEILNHNGLDLFDIANMSDDEVLSIKRAINSYDTIRRDMLEYFEYLQRQDDNIKELLSKAKQEERDRRWMMDQLAEIGISLKKNNKD